MCLELSSWVGTLVDFLSTFRFLWFLLPMTGYSGFQILPWNLLVWNVTIVSEVESSRPSHHKRNYVSTLDNQEGPFSIPEACEVRLFHESFSANTSLQIHPWVNENRGHLKRKATFSQRTCLVKNIENKLEGVFGSTLSGLVASVCTPQPTRTPQLPTLLAQAT